MAGSAGLMGMRQPLLHSHYNQPKLDLSRVKAHIAHKAGYKQIGKHLVTQSFSAKLKRWLIGNSYEEHNHRSRYQASQRVSLSIIAARRRAKLNRPDCQDPNVNKELIQNDERVKNRFYSQDNLALNVKFLDSGEASHRDEQVKHLSKRNRIAAWASRFGHYFRGTVESTIAPSGVMLKWSTIMTQPKRDARSIGNQIRATIALGGICCLVGAIATWAFTNGLKPAFATLFSVAGYAAANIAGILASFSASGALFSGLSLVSSGVCAAVVDKKDTLSSAAFNHVNQEHSKHIAYLTQLLLEVADKPGAIALLSKALKKKIPMSRCENGSTKDNNLQPLLLKHLLQSVQDYRAQPGKLYVGFSDEGLQNAIENALGDYLIAKDVHNLNVGQPGNQIDVSNRRALLSRENDVLALTNLVEHVSIQKIEAYKRIENPDGSITYTKKGMDKSLLDARGRTDHGAEWLRDKTVFGLSKVMDAIGGKSAQAKAKKMRAWLTKDGLQARESEKANSEQRYKHVHSLDVILDNPHQYSAATVFFARFAEGIRVFNIGVVLSLNYLVTRPIAAAMGAFQTHVLGLPEERTVSWAFGRFISSAAWAVAEVVVFIGLASGNGVAFTGGEGAFEGKTMPFNMGNIAISVISTAMHMLFVGGLAYIPGLIATTLAKNGGYNNGGSSRVMSQPELDQRKYLVWA